ncbi:MAG: hypothetical protein KKA52_05315, partial [Candidatus Omnitrophica bacterium]|nr:hypothetical protein [Candidatus Omnitrophota bacterium]
ANTAYSLTYKEYSAGTGIQIDANASSYQVQPGELINLTVTCSNVDTWVEYEQADGSNPPEAVVKSSGSSKDMLKLPWWSCSDGRFDCPQGDDIYWQAPDEPGTYKITVEVENKDENQFADEKGVREIEIEVLGEGGESSGRQDSLSKDAQQGNESAAANQDAMAGGGQEKDARLASADLNTLLNDLPPIVPLSDKFNTQMMSDLSYDNSPPFNESASRKGDEVKVTETKTETDTGTMWSKVIDYASEAFDLAMGYSVYIAEQSIAKIKETVITGKEVYDDVRDYTNHIAEQAISKVVAKSKEVHENVTTGLGDIMYQAEKFGGATEPYPTYQKTSEVTVKIDQDLNCGGIWVEEEKVMGMLDGATLLLKVKQRCGESNKYSASSYEVAVKEGTKGISVSGANTDGTALDELTQALAKEVDCSFTITHSAGSGVPLQAENTTDKVMLISPQSTRQELEQWIDARGLKKENVMVVDVKGDLVYIPQGYIDQEALTKVPYLPTNPINSIISGVGNAVTNTAYRDYSPNPNDKYTYVRIEALDGYDNLGYNSFKIHDEPISKGLSDQKYIVSINGETKSQSVTLEKLYTSLLRGYFK